MFKTTSDIRAYIAYYNYSLETIIQTIACYRFNNQISRALAKDGDAPPKLILALHRAINDDLLQPIPTHWSL